MDHVMYVSRSRFKVVHVCTLSPLSLSLLDPLSLSLCLSRRPSHRHFPHHCPSRRNWPQHWHDLLRPGVEQPRVPPPACDSFCWRGIWNCKHKRRKRIMKKKTKLVKRNKKNIKQTKPPTLETVQLWVRRTIPEPVCWCFSSLSSWLSSTRTFSVRSSFRNSRRKKDHLKHNQQWNNRY